MEDLDLEKIVEDLEKNESGQEIKKEDETSTSTSVSVDYTEKIDKVNDSLDILIFTTSLLCGLILALLFGWGFNSNAK